MTHKYKIKYKVVIEDKEEGYISTDACEDEGLTDALVLFSILYQEDGSYSQCIALSADGRSKKNLSQSEIFTLWMTLGFSLSQADGLPPGQHRFAKWFTKEVREIFECS